MWTAPFLQHQPKAVVGPCGSIGRSGLVAVLAAGSLNDRKGSAVQSLWRGCDQTRGSPPSRLIPRPAHLVHRFGHLALPQQLVEHPRDVLHPFGDDMGDRPLALEPPRDLDAPTRD